MAFVGLGVSGGIGAYKAVEVARLLQKRGHRVQAVMTRTARRFVGPLTFEAITREPVITSQFAPGMNADIEHIALASSLDLLLVAPATANIIGKFANGIADDFLSALYLATHGARPDGAGDEHQHVGAPGGGGERRDAGRAAACGSSIRAMATSRAAGSARAGSPSRRRSSRPSSGLLQCTGEPRGQTRARHRRTDARGSGSGALSRQSIERPHGLRDRAEAARRGAAVTLVAGPTPLDPPAVVEVVRVRSAAEMHAAVMAARRRRDVVIMAAAVADYTPAPVRLRAKIRKVDKGGPLTLTLERTPDILAELGAARGSAAAPVLVGFAAQTGDPGAGRAAQADERSTSTSSSPTT